jgi:hypothetical protein
MAKKFLVILKERDRIREILTILEGVVTPGAKVIFLVPYPVDTWAWLRDHWITTEFVRRAVPDGRRIMARYSWEEQKRLAEIRIASARRALENIGAEVSVVLQSGLNRALRDYVLDTDFRMFLISTANGNATIELLRLFLVLLRRIKSRGFISFMPAESLGEAPAGGRRQLSAERRDLHACNGF